MLKDTRGARHFHRILITALPDWERVGWSLVAHDASSPSLAAQGTRAALIEWAHDGEPVVP